MTLNEVEQIFWRAPVREIGKQKLRGYFQSELKRVGVTKGQLKKLVSEDVILQGDFKCTKGQRMNFYYLDPKG